MAKDQSGSSELYGIQMLRAVAALAVVVHHTLEQSNGAIGRFSPDWLTTSGASGVDIFFVISGFIMLHVSSRRDRQPPTAGDFLFRRATRIYPFYWLCCLAVLLISALGFLASHHYGPATILKSLLLLPGDKVIGVSWTLVYEVYFYLLFAATLWARSPRLTIVCTTLAIIAVQVLAFWLAAADPGRLGTSDLVAFLANPLPLEFCFGLGLAFAYSLRARKGGGWPVPLPAAILGLVLLAIAPMFVAHADTTGLPALPRVVTWGIPAALIVAGFLTFGAPRNAAARFWVLLGDASYALYLTHVFVMMGYGRLVKVSAFSKLPQLPVVFGIVLLAVALGLAAHLLVEKPLLSLIRRMTHRQTGHASTV